MDKSRPGDPHFCSMKITKEVRKHAAKQGVSEDALAKGMVAKRRSLWSGQRKYKLECNPAFRNARCSLRS